MKIDQANGTVRFPNGFSISPNCTRDSFRATTMGTGATSRDCGTSPWIHYQFSGGDIDGNDLIVAVCFYDRMLVYVELTVSLYAPDQRDWSHYSLDVEAAQKNLHERILETQFGKPQIGASILPARFPANQNTLNQRADWGFKWGRVSSCHDSKGGGTFVCVNYGDRMEKAMSAYRSQGKTFHVLKDRPKINIILTRDSVCAADDCDAPHEKSVRIDSFTDPKELARETSCGYLPNVAGVGHVWTCVLNDTKSAEIKTDRIRPLMREASFSEVNRIHFVYKSAKH